MLRVLALPVGLVLLLGCQAGTEPSATTDTPAPTTSAEPTASAQTPATPTADESDAALPPSTTAPPSTQTRDTGADEGTTPAPEDTRVLNARLIDAAWDNDLGRAKRLIETGADVNAKDETDQSAYLIATSEGYLRLLELTLRFGADVDSLDSFNGTGLIRAAERGHADVVGRLLQTDIEVNHVNRLGWTALHEAIILGDGSRSYVDTVRLLVAGGANVRLRSERDGVRPLEHARVHGFETIATTLRAALRADEARRDPQQAGRRLLEAARRGDADAAAVALRAGAALEVRDQDRRTPLLLAAANGHADVARLLFWLGADPSVTGDEGRTPQQHARMGGHAEIARLLAAAR